MIKISTKDMVIVAMFSAIIAVLGYVYVSIPFSPVPITGQTLGIMIIGLLLTPKQAILSVIVWIFSGIVGAPVFSGGRAGISVLVSPTGGYIIGFLFAAYLISYFKGKNINIIRMTIVSLICGVGVIYLFGVPWLAYSTGMDLYTAFTKGAFPFLIGDIIKVVLAVNLGYVLRKRLKHLIVE